MALKFYRLQKISEGTIKLQAGEAVPAKGPTTVGIGKSKNATVELSRLIDLLNEQLRHRTFTQADELFFMQLREEAMFPSSVQSAADVPRRVRRVFPAAEAPSR